jgi:uncharacterized protein
MRRSLPKALLTLLILPFLVVAAGCQDDDGAFSAAEADEARTLPPRGSAWVIFDQDTVLAEVADTPEDRERGLMHRTEVPDGTGMLFVFDDMGTRQFWMRNTYVPLDIAFMDINQRVVDIQQMEPETDEFTESAAPAMFALEVRSGWFEEQGISQGSEAQIVFGRR